MSLVIDASVALRWFVEAPGSDAAVTLLEGEESLIAPDLVIAEVTNAAWKLVRAGEITEEHGLRIAGAVPSIFASLAGASTLASRAFALARAIDHPVYECVYLALAEARGTRVVTADQRLLDHLRGTRWKGLARPLVGG